MNEYLEKEIFYAQLKNGELRKIEAASAEKALELASEMYDERLVMVGKLQKITALKNKVAGNEK